MAAYILDITEQKQAEEKLLSAMLEVDEASRAKSEFLLRMRYELRLPINAILGFSQLLKMNIDNNLSAEDLEYSHEILKADNHLLKLIYEVLELSRIDVDILTLPIENIALTSLIDDTITLSLHSSIEMDLIKPCRFDLILLDINLGDDEDGCDVLERLRADSQTIQIPVIAVRANTSCHDIHKGLTAGWCHITGLTQLNFNRYRLNDFFDLVQIKDLERILYCIGFSFKSAAFKLR